MKQIIATEGLAFPEKDLGVPMDTSALLSAGIVHYESSDEGEWVERNPFEGREPVPEGLRSTIEAILSTAESILNAPPEPNDPDEVPASVTRRQARQQLLAEGLLDQVQPAIDAIQDSMQRGMMQIFWDDAQEFERTNLELIGLGHAIGLSDSEIDELFRKAAQR